MSVAFRRESDEEHKEPKFELPLPPGPNLVTARGLALIEAKAGALLFGSGMAAATAVFQALSPGDHVVASRVSIVLTAMPAALAIAALTIAASAIPASTAPP